MGGYFTALVWVPLPMVVGLPPYVGSYPAAIAVPLPASLFSPLGLSAAPSVFGALPRKAPRPLRAGHETKERWQRVFLTGLIKAKGARHSIVYTLHGGAVSGERARLKAVINAKG